MTLPVRNTSRRCSSRWSDISSYYDPDEGWSYDELYALFGEELKPMEEEEKDNEDEEDEGEEDKDDGDDNGGNNNSGRANNGSSGYNGDNDNNGGVGDNGGSGDNGDEAAPPAKRHKKECGSSGTKDSYCFGIGNPTVQSNQVS
jgi:hypothetical protein